MLVATQQGGTGVQLQGLQAPLVAQVPHLRHHCLGFLGFCIHFRADVLWTVCIPLDGHASQRSA